MNITILGSTSSTGRVLVEKALERGHKVRTLARSPEKLGLLRDRIVVIQGNYFDRDRLAEALRGSEAVVSTIGMTRRRQPGETVRHYAHAMEALTELAAEKGIRRVVVIAGAATRLPGERFRGRHRMFRWIVRLTAWPIVSAKERETAILTASDLDWTIVRPPRITAGEGRLVATENAPASFRVDTAALADFMLDALEGDEWVRKAPFAALMA